MKCHPRRLQQTLLKTAADAVGTSLTRSALTFEVNVDDILRFSPKGLLKVGAEGKLEV